MQDRVHQPYRKHLVPSLSPSSPPLSLDFAYGKIPGLPDILASVTPSSHPGLLGICLSGAGPTILALATHNFEGIGGVIVGKFREEGITCRTEVLVPAYGGAAIEYEDLPTIEVADLS